MSTFVIGSGPTYVGTDGKVGATGAIGATGCAEYGAGAYPFCGGYCGAP
jgi:hypothetical protein